ncbi:MAG: hypothetical protein MH137_04895 [Flavobacteriales bacterium]|nr:hypothetical protein [Flavobacteriales bacterium]
MSNVKDKVYVFVVCGDASHIHTLHYSLAALKKRTKQPVWIVTDHSRNEIPIQHEHVIHIQVPDTYSNHQAAIYLKTGLAHHLPKGNLYCYLDTDVVAIHKNPDSVFDEYKAPVLFAPDHLPLCFFSPYAVNCRCIEDFHSDLEAYKTHVLAEKNEVYMRINALMSNKQSGWINFIQLRCRYFLSARFFNLNAEYRFDKKTKEWFLKGKNMTVEEFYSFENIFSDKEYMKEYLKVKTLSSSVFSGFSNVCTHIFSSIKSKFELDITDWNWQHWNGGVFLFSDESESFMNLWHSYCISLFQDSEWKVRDQGALIAAVWKMGLQNHDKLSSKFNFIVDYENKALEINEKDALFSHNGKDWLKPEFVHVFHHFGDEHWTVWKYIMKNAANDMYA